MVKLWDEGLRYVALSRTSAVCTWSGHKAIGMLSLHLPEMGLDLGPAIQDHYFKTSVQHQPCHVLRRP